MREKIITTELKHRLPEFAEQSNYEKILQFYLFESPVEETSYRGKTFKDQGWKSQNLRTLKKQMLKVASPELSNNYFPCQKAELEKCITGIQKPQEEYCIFLNSIGAVTSVFKAIRNALAHGSFDVRNYDGEVVYFFANYNKYYKAKIVLKEKTLLEWIKVFNKGPNAFNKKGAHK